MIQKYLRIVLFVLAGSILCSCTCRPINQAIITKPEEAKPITTEAVCPDVQIDQCTQVSTEQYVKKVDNFIIIFDPSASMSENCSEECLEDCPKGPKFDYAKNIVTCMNQTIPDLELKGAFRTFGAPVYTSITYGPDDYTKEDLAHAIKEVVSADGVSPLDFAIRATGEDWDSEQGKIAVIILSDGVDMDIEPVLAAEKLKKQYGENICIYTILIGNDKNGWKILSDVAQAGECGFAVKAKDLANQAGMTDFVKSVFLMLDIDGDGVPYDRDDCPDTQTGLEVDENGCFHAVISGDVLFDFDKYVIKPEAYQILDAIAEILNNNPGIAMEIHGHTDFKGTEKYNDVLSINRAKAGKQYFVNKGINSKRIFIKGFGELQPVAPNQTDEGRALNRRIEFKRVR